MKRAKIVATIGPASSSAEAIRGLIEAGVDVFRLNFSHGAHEAHRRSFELAREAAAAAGLHVAVMADLCGPKIRIGEIAGGEVAIRAGDEVVITTTPVVGDAARFSTIYEALPRDVSAGHRILIDDGSLELEVLFAEGAEVRCRVVVGGPLKSRKGMNIPGTPLSTPALTQKDKEDLRFAAALGVDYFALSFVRTAADVHEAKALAGPIPVIAKIEKPEAIDNLDAILAACDGVMVARGDLGVEAKAQKVPLLQKRIIRCAGRLGKPVIVATQMLESMIENRRPTRAEVSDVANAVLDGADAVMLSGETAVGRYPIEAVREMVAILDEVDRSDFWDPAAHVIRIDEYSFSNAVARAAVTAAQDLGLKALAVYTETGHSATLVSACRPRSAVIALSRHPAVLRRLALYWGVAPVEAAWVEGVRGVVDQAERILLERAIAERGDDVVITFGMQDMRGPGRTDVMKLWRIGG